MMVYITPLKSVGQLEKMAQSVKSVSNTSYGKKKFRIRSTSVEDIALSSQAPK